MTKIPFYLVTGFLGSGKTTLLKKYLEKFSDNKRIAIIQNEFAEINIDSHDLKHTGKSFEILEMNNGSVFCVCLLGDFVTSLSNFIQQHHPDVLILEASGLSDPISISQVLGSPLLKEKLWLAHSYTVVDAVNFHKTLDRVGRNTHQIRVADTVVINKCDLAADPVSEIENRIKMINPFAKIVQTSYCDIEFMEALSFRSAVGLAIDSKIEPSKKPDIDSIVIKTTKRISPAYFQLFIEKWSRETYRIKGFVQTEEGALAVQTSFDRIESFDIPTYKDPTQVVILGKGLDQKILHKEFEDLCTRK